MSFTNEEIAQALGQMTVLEVIALTKQLEQQWDVKAEPQIVVRVSTVEAVQEAKTEFSVVLMSVPADKKMNVIKAIRDVLVLGLKESKDIAESCPKTIMENASKEEAERLQARLTEAGAVVELK